MAWTHSSDLNHLPCPPLSNLRTLENRYLEYLQQLADNTPPLELTPASCIPNSAAPVSMGQHPYDYMYTVYGCAVPSGVFYSGLQQWMDPMPNILSTYSSVLSPHTLEGYRQGLANMPYQQSVDMLHAVIEEVEPPVGVSKTDVNDSKPLRKDRKNTTIVGEPSLGFECNGRQYIRLSDGELEQDLRAMREPDYRGFFHGFGDKVTYVIALENKKNYRFKQRYCCQILNGVSLYFTRERIAREIVQVTKEFLKSYPDFYVYAAFRDWPADSTINNFALAGLRKVSRASVQIIFQYLPAPPPTSV